ncbi:hypothetical protein [Methanogenium cariaci]|jgi:uncharacterized membrane protein|uniref:hypothetical protein n=1 Tax=Methanogenium cariaci TaxID=2197 RepID=UPI000784A7D9|nr:hypothetical protein [Methanogenium cariaci]
MKKSRKYVLALTGLVVLCVCAAMAVPMGAGDGTGHKGMMKDGTGIHFSLEKMQANGIDTTVLETALENGDREAVHAFLEANRPADAPMMNEERMQRMIQRMIQRMQEKGIDTTALETALESGDREVVHAFMEANRPADAGTGFRLGGPLFE